MTFVILKHQTSEVVIKERLKPSSKARNKLMEESGKLNKVKSLGKANSGKNCSRAWLRCVKLIRNGPKKIKNLTESSPNRAETGLEQRENEVGL